MHINWAAREKQLRTILDNANSYITSYQEATKAKVVTAVDSWLKNAALSGVKTDVETVLGGELAEVWGKVSGDMKRMIATEANNSKNTGALDGIIRVNLAHGIEDPVVIFITVRDSKRCDECTRLHMMDDGITPRCWYISEIGHGYHKKGENDPKIGGLHPHCRCGLCSMFPGYGFNDKGFITFKGIGYNVLEEQRGIKKP